MLYTNVVSTKNGLDNIMHININIITWGFLNTIIGYQKTFVNFEQSDKCIDIQWVFKGGKMYRSIFIWIGKYNVFFVYSYWNLICERPQNLKPINSYFNGNIILVIWTTIDKLPPDRFNCNMLSLNGRREQGRIGHVLKLLKLDSW
jgi:hypothetical protein